MSVLTFVREADEGFVPLQSPAVSKLMERHLSSVLHLTRRMTYG